ncbi:MAG: hypothetical protein ABJQ29_05660 [Luteolibacter sp.]
MKYSLSPRVRLLTLLFTLAFSTLSYADRTAQMLYFKAPQGAPETAAIYQVGKDPVEVELARNNFSKSFDLAEGDLILGFLPAMLPEDAEFPANAPTAKVPSGWEKVLILAFHDPKNPVMPVRFKVINASAGELGNGDRMFINFTDSDVFGLVGNKKLALRANATAIVKNAAAPGEEYQVQIDRIDPVRKKRLTFIRQIWRQSATSRSLIFIYSPPGSTAVTYYNAPVRDL